MISVSSFDDTDSPVHRILSEVFGFAAFRDPQQAVIAHVLAGGDALVLMPTGSGKSLCYQIPALALDGTAVVISPLIALMQQQVDHLRALGVAAASLDSTQSAPESARIEQALLRGEIKILYVSPERLLMPRCIRLLKRIQLSLFAIDEAHCVSQWGHDFRPEYMQLSVLAEIWPTVGRLALTASATQATACEILERLALAPARVFQTSYDRPNIYYQVEAKDDVRQQLTAFVRSRALVGSDAQSTAASGIVYCASRSRVEMVARWLQQAGFYALAYHAGLESDERQRRQRQFIEQPGCVMVATIAFGMGIDKADVRFVAHVDVPRSMEGYFQETGRAGRDGKPATAWMCWGLDDVARAHRIAGLGQADAIRSRVQREAFQEMLGFCGNSACRRQTLLAHFGESIPACGHCDNCLAAQQDLDVTIPAQKLLSAIYRLWRERDQRYGASHLIDILRGRLTRRVRELDHQSLSVFGIGQDWSERQWRRLILQLLGEGVLVMDDEGYRTLALTSASVAVLRAERRLRMRAAEIAEGFVEPMVDMPAATG